MTGPLGLAPPLRDPAPRTRTRAAPRPAPATPSALRARRAPAREAGAGARRAPRGRGGPGPARPGRPRAAPGAPRARPGRRQRLYLRVSAALARRAAAMALVTLQRSPTPSAASSSASNSEVSPGPAAPARPSSRRARPGPRVGGGEQLRGGRTCGDALTTPPGQPAGDFCLGDRVCGCHPGPAVTVRCDPCLG